MILSFKATSTKTNFIVLCVECDTTLEHNLGDIDGQRMRKMERNMEKISTELMEIKKLVSKSINNTSSADCNNKGVTVVSDTTKNVEPTPNIWNDKEKLATVIAKPAESTLVINKATDDAVDKSNTDIIENMVIENKIPIKRSFKDKNGNLHVVCTSVESRDELKTQVTASNNNIEMKTPTENRPVVSIVGLTKQYEKEEVVDILVKQNDFLT